MSEQKPDRQPNLQNRLKQWLTHRSSGDTIVANIGANARDVIVGKNIIKIGTFQVPTLPVVLTLLLVIGAAALVGWIAFVPDKMTGAFTVAVADFGELDAQGQVHSSENGSQLSQWVFHALESEFQSLPRDLRQTLDPQVWHDSLGPLKIRAHIGVIPNDQNAACQKAAELGADILIYGNLSQNQNPATFVPRFCIRQAGKDTTELDDIMGIHQFGAPIPVPVPLNLGSDPVARLGINSKLVTRVNALSRLTIGLLYDLTGQLDTALDVFVKTDTELRWDDRDGKEVLYYFIGKQYLYLNRLPEARAAFNKALSLNPQYARAHIGLGSTFYVQAQDLAQPQDRLKTNDLDTATAEYQKGLALSQEQKDRQTELQAHIALGTVYRLKGEAFLFQNDLDQAGAQYDLAVQEINTGIGLLDPLQYRLLAQANLALGATVQQQAHIRLVQGDRNGSRTMFEKASVFYDRCIHESDAHPEDAFLADRIKSAACVPYKRDVEQALADLRNKP